MHWNSGETLDTTFSGTGACCPRKAAPHCLLPPGLPVCHEAFKLAHGLSLRWTHAYRNAPLASSPPFSGAIGAGLQGLQAQGQHWIYFQKSHLVMHGCRVQRLPQGDVFNSRTTEQSLSYFLARSEKKQSSERHWASETSGKLLA